jgi:hypothetical protein
MSPEWEDRSKAVLARVLAERHRQVERYGLNDECPDGTGSGVQWLRSAGVNLDLCDATEIEAAFREEYEKFEARHGVPTWMHLVREEVAEAFKESDPARLAEELVQVAALCVSWVEALGRREH